MSGQKAPGYRGLVEFPAPSSRDLLLPGLALAFLTLIAFWPAHHAGFIWDDDAYVTQNPLLTAPDGLRRIWFSLDSPSQYFPLTYTTFYFERALWGLNPAGYHCINILLHIANAVLAWRVLARLRVPGAWLAAAIFAIHPVQVESVAWITERKNVLMGFFFLLSLLAWINFINDKGNPNPSWRHYGLALLFYALALFAKTTACTLPATLLLILWLKKIPIDARRLAQVAPFVIIGVAMGLVTVWWEGHHQGTKAMAFGLGPIDRVLIACRALWFYLGKLFWPANLAFSYPRWHISASDPRGYLWVLMTTATALIITLVRTWTGRGLEVAALFFAATLTPVLGFVMLYTFAYSFVADHYQYLACLGPIALVVAAVKCGLDRIGQPLLQPVLGAVLLATLAPLTWKQCEIYTSAETLWRATLALNPDSWLAHNNLANILHQKGSVGGAIIHYEEALKGAPDNESIHFNLANALYQEGRAGEAIIQFQAALRLVPNDVEAENNLAWLLATASQPGLRNGNQAVQLAWHATQETAGRNPVILGTLAAALAETGRYNDAAQYAQKALEMARAANRADLAAKFGHELERYQAGQPLHP
jgi:Tfp pilus assembly protein PilF